MTKACKGKIVEGGRCKRTFTVIDRGDPSVGIFGGEHEVSFISDSELDEQDEKTIKQFLHGFYDINGVVMTEKELRDEQRMELKTDIEGLKFYIENYDDALPASGGKARLKKDLKDMKKRYARLGD